MYSVSRLLALFIVALASHHLTRVEYHSWFSVILLGHYVLALVSSRRFVFAAFNRPSTYLSLIVLSLFTCFAIYTSVPDLLLYFGIHVILSDTYIQDGDLTREGISLRFLNPLRLSFNTLIYILAVHFQTPFNKFDPYLLAQAGVILIAMELIFTGFLLAKQWSQSLFDLLVFDFFGGVAACVLATKYVVLIDVIFYHILFWFFVPLIKASRKGPDALWHYLGTTAVATFSFLPFMPISLGIGERNSADWIVCVQKLGYIHISSSFVLSRANPKWILKIFQGDKTAESS